MARLIASLALLAYAFVGTNYAGIWCFGTDGHVAFEQLSAEHPLVSDSSAISLFGGRPMILTAAGDTRSGGSHGPCFDVALDASSQWHAGTTVEGPRVLAPPVAFAPAAAAVVLPYAVSTPRDLVARGETAGDPALTSLRSTVLRI
jgi:hypothetical protein